MSRDFLQSSTLNAVTRLGLAGLLSLGLLYLMHDQQRLGAKQQDTYAAIVTSLQQAVVALQLSVSEQKKSLETQSLALQEFMRGVNAQHSEQIKLMELLQKASQNIQAQIQRKQTSGTGSNPDNIGDIWR
jgi:hypothetical protein